MAATAMTVSDEIIFQIARDDNIMKRKMAFYASGRIIVGLPVYTESVLCGGTDCVTIPVSVLWRAEEAVDAKEVKVSFFIPFFISNLPALRGICSINNSIL